MIKKIRYYLAFMLLLMLVFGSSASAATKFEGMTAFRDGVLGGLEWHGGVWVKPDKNYSLPIVHIGGSGYMVNEVPYSGTGDDFLDGNNFKGVYYKNSATPRDYFKNMALDLAGRSIAYCAYYMLEHDADGSWIYPADVSKMRCDGVIEYCYEWYSVKLCTITSYGTEYWDITNTTDCSWHTAQYFTPFYQANYTLTKYSSDPE